eukprot:jgi/Botrbrau1/17667/Bobra.0166s0093.1
MAEVKEQHAANKTKKGKHRLNDARGAPVTIPAAIALGSVSVLVAAGYVWAKRRRSGRQTTSPVQPNAPVASTPAGPAVGIQDLVGIPDPWMTQPDGDHSGQGDLLPIQATAFSPLSVPLLDLFLPMSVREAWHALFVDQHFQSGFLMQRQHQDLQAGPWLLQDNRASRRVRYVSPVKKNMLGPRSALCLEEWMCGVRSGAAFVADCRVFNPKVPYGKSFHSQLRWAAVATGQTITRLQVSADVVFTSHIHVPGVSSLIRSATREGMREHYAEYAQWLVHHKGAHLSQPRGIPVGDLWGSLQHVSSSSSPSSSPPRKLPAPSDSVRKKAAPPPRKRALMPPIILLAVLLLLLVWLSQNKRFLESETAASLLELQGILVGTAVMGTTWLRNHITALSATNSSFSQTFVVRVKVPQNAPVVPPAGPGMPKGRLLEAPPVIVEVTTAAPEQARVEEPLGDWEGSKGARPGTDKHHASGEESLEAEAGGHQVTLGVAMSGAGLNGSPRGPRWDGSPGGAHGSHQEASGMDMSTAPTGDGTIGGSSGASTGGEVGGGKGSVRDRVGTGQTDAEAEIGVEEGWVEVEAGRGDGGDGEESEGGNGAEIGGEEWRVEVQAGGEDSGI